MLYNVRIFGKRYNRKTKEFIYNLIDKFTDDINYTNFLTTEKVKQEIKLLKDDVIRCRFFNNGKTVISLNKVK